MDNTDPYKTKFKEERLYMSTNQNLMQHMRELIDRIKAADVAYYRDDNPTMTDREYDLLVDELKELETTTGLILSGSPTQTVPGEILKELTPVRHTKPMLSADKTKSVDEMLRFANGRPVVFSWKLDGLTIVLRYEGGEFKQAITRGREGIIGEDVTHTVRTFMNVPMCIRQTKSFRRLQRTGPKAENWIIRIPAPAAVQGSHSIPCREEASSCFARIRPVQPNWFRSLTISAKKPA